VKSIFSGFLVAFSLYSAVPVPQVTWEKKTMRWALSFLPLVGLLIGGVEWLWFHFCIVFNASVIFYAVIAALLPLIISGGIHLDGLCDTCDALCSFGDQEKRLAILKDSHVGAFGPLWLMAFLMAETACFAQVYETPQGFPMICISFATARAMGGCKIVTMPCAKNSGLVYLFAENSDKKTVFVTLIFEIMLYFVIKAYYLHFVCAGLCLAAAGIMVFWYLLHHKMCLSAFGGITGDLTGFFISLTELLFLAIAAIGGLIL
jgi:adenosylcobinamide-GDP ribazoletransferase